MKKTNHIPDFIVENHGSIFLLYPRTPAADDWVEENIPDNAQHWCGSIAVEHGCICDILNGINDAGLACRAE